MNHSWHFAAVILVLVPLFAGCEKKAASLSAAQTPPPVTATVGKAQPAPSTAPQQKVADTTTTSSTAEPKTTEIPGLKIKDIKVGTGAAAKDGDTVTVNYTGRLTDGTKFDSSLDHGQPFTFHLGAGEVIKGWDKGVAGMKVGGKRKLTISPELGYGDRGAGTVIPPNATLVFDIELLDVK